MQVFIAGIMQGSRQDEGVEGQTYRVQIAETLKRHVPGAQIVDPWQIHPASPTYTDEEAAQTFLSMTALAGKVDVVIAYLPHASMGTAIEMWTAYHAGKPIVVVSPLRHNWVIRLCAQEVLPDMESLQAFIADGRLAGLVNTPPPTD